MGETLNIEVRDRVAILTMNRPDKRNAMNDDLLAAFDDFFQRPPAEARVVVITGSGGHFCAGLDLSEHVARDAEGCLHHSRGWHAVMDRIQNSGLPVVSAMQGAVIGGGLELATSTHVRIAEPSCVFQLPEGRRGIFVGGGATVRVGRILGHDRMVEMMLTGRKYFAEEGLSLGLAHYLVRQGEAMERALQIAEQIASNAPMSNYMMLHGVRRIVEMGPDQGLFMESVCAALAQTSPDAAEGLAAFLEKRAPQFR
ncbi:MAG: crotonase/enoyl-CoA hydratase family protein [Pseudomonadota bacterium]